MTGRVRPAWRIDGWDPVRAWRFIRVSRGYRRAWRRLVPPPGLPERAPFPVRLQTAVDLAALEWGMLAWEDPCAEDGPASPFWAWTAMSAGMVAPGGAPLAGLAAAGDASLSGLRPRRRRAGPEDRAERRGGAGPHSRRRVVFRGRRAASGARSGAHRGYLVRHPRPSPGAGSGDGDGELLLVLEGEAEDRSHREIAAQIWGRDRVDAEYYTDGWMHSRIKRRLRKAKAILRQYRRMAVGGETA